MNKKYYKYVPMPPIFKYWKLVVLEIGSIPRRGFTLIELLVVMALFGVLAAGLFTLVNPVEQFRRGRDTQRKNDLAQIQRALEQYYNDFGYYPPTSSSPNWYVVSSSFPWGNPWPPYMDKIPKDPTTGYNYKYVLGPTNQTYYIYARIERDIRDSQICFPASGGTPGAKCTNAPATAVCGTAAGDCNFGVSSPNASP